MSGSVTLKLPFPSHRIPGSLKAHPEHSVIDPHLVPSLSLDTSRGGTSPGRGVESSELNWLCIQRQRGRNFLHMAPDPFLWCEENPSPRVHPTHQFWLNLSPWEPLHSSQAGSTPWRNLECWNQPVPPLPLVWRANLHNYCTMAEIEGEKVRKTFGL